LEFGWECNISAEDAKGKYLLDQFRRAKEKNKEVVVTQAMGMARKFAVARRLL
jgi:hypothetical protein